MRRVLAIVAVLACALFQAAPVRADDTFDCFSDDIERRIAGCTALIERGAGGGIDLSLAYAMRGLAYSLKKQYGDAIPDYDIAIRLNPDFAVALNNRAWAYYRWGRASQGLPDVERSLWLNPLSPHAFDTRAHIRQAQGDTAGARKDYDEAMRVGGSRMIRLYQCGLTEQGRYKGEIDGVWRPEVDAALNACVLDATCDPLPADEQCRAATS